MQLKENEAVSFASWLESNTDLKGKSKRDVVSRVRRLNIKINHSISDAEIARKVSLIASEQGFSMYVTSQLKRAYRLYRDFLKDSV